MSKKRKDLMRLKIHYHLGTLKSIKKYEAYNNYFYKRSSGMLLLKRMRKDYKSIIFESLQMIFQSRRSMISIPAYLPGSNVKNVSGSSVSVVILVISIIILFPSLLKYVIAIILYVVLSISNLIRE